MGEWPLVDHQAWPFDHDPRTGPLWIPAEGRSNGWEGGASRRGRPAAPITFAVSGQRRPVPGKGHRVTTDENMSTTGDLAGTGLDADLRADIRRLGVLLGQTLARQEGQPVL